MTVMEKFRWKSCLVFRGPTVQLLGENEGSTSGVTKGAANFSPETIFPYPLE